VRVLWWSELFAPYIGGVEVLGSRLLPALQRRGHEVAVITGHGSLDLPDRGEFDGVAVHRLPFATRAGYST
jgi:Glycosyl transferase 4-like domain